MSAEAMRMNLSELRKPERNIRIHTEAQLKEFERSLKMFGQLRPIVIDENNVILAGNGLYETMLRLGQKDADVYRYAGLSENQKKKLMIADNKIYGLGLEDYDTLDVFLAELKDDLDIPGFDEDILKKMMLDVDGISEAMSDYGKLSQEEAATIAAGAERKQERLRDAETEKDGENASHRSSENRDGATGEITCPNCGAVIACP
jgi:ParB-like chromosome segregation protein Spo0J